MSDVLVIAGTLRETVPLSNRGSIQVHEIRPGQFDAEYVTPGGILIPLKGCKHREQEGARSLALIWAACEGHEAAEKSV